MENKKILWLTVGLPRSGKSTWAREMINGNAGAGFAVVNPDSIRMVLHGTPFRAEAEAMVWAIAHTMVESLFLAGHNEVILDACNHTARRRNEWLSKKWECKYVEFDTDEQVCIERAGTTDQLYLRPIIRRMAKEITWPNESTQ